MWEINALGVNLIQKVKNLPIGSLSVKENTDGVISSINEQFKYMYFIDFPVSSVCVEFIYEIILFLRWSFS